MNIYDRSLSIYTPIKNRLSLSHVIYTTNPYIHIIKCCLVCVVVLLVDFKVTKQPDSLTSLFTALLCISPTVLLGWSAGLSIFSASMIGTFYGSIITIIFHIKGDYVLHFDGYSILGNDPQTCLLSPNCVIYQWLLLAKLSLGIAVTTYTLFVMKREDSGSLATGFFSSFYVQLVPQTWSFALNQPSIDWWTNNNVITTVIVRIIATATGLVAALIINALISGIFMQRIFLKRLCLIEKTIIETIDTSETDPSNIKIQIMFDLLFGWLNDVTMAINEANLRHTLYIDRLCGDDRAQLKALHDKVINIFNLMTVQLCFSLSSKIDRLHPQEKECIKQMLEGSKKRNIDQFIEKELLINSTDSINKEDMRQSLALLKNMMLHFVSAVENQVETV